MSVVWEFLLNISSSLKSGFVDFFITKNPTFYDIIVKLIKLQESTSYIKLPDPKALLLKDEVTSESLTSLNKFKSYIIVDIDDILESDSNSESTTVFNDVTPEANPQPVVVPKNNIINITPEEYIVDDDDDLKDQFSSSDYE